MKNLRTVILAAGKGTRMKSDTPKVLHPLCGRPMIQYVLDAVKGVGSLKNYVVLGHQFESVRKTLGPETISVRQQRLLGTADAVRQTAGLFRGYRGDILILCGDTPLLTTRTLKDLVRRHRQNGADLTVLTAVVENSTGYGRIIRGDSGAVSAIREEKDATAQEKNISEINVGVYCVRAARLFSALKKVPRNQKKGEYYLTDIVGIISREGGVIAAERVEEPREGLGINTREELTAAAGMIRQKILSRLMLSGVTIEDPATTFIQADVRIGRDTVIRPFTVIENDVRIGEGCTIGPFARLRPGTRIGRRVEIGNYAEVSRSQMGDGCFMKHFSFLGDARVGSRVNIGAGTVTANFDGKNKNTTVIRDEAFIGSDSILVAPVVVGKAAMTGAGCVVTRGKRVPDGGVIVGVPGRLLRKKTKDG